MFDVFCVGSDLWNEMITCSEERVCVCVCNCVSSKNIENEAARARVGL